MSVTEKLSCYHRDNCRFCGAKDLFCYIDLGEHPPSNSFISTEDLDSERRFPLKVYLCRNCGLSQLLDVVAASDIFDEYMYLSSTSRALRNHYQEMVNNILSLFKVTAGSLVIDIGCNDGITLRCYPKDKYRLLGIEPSSAGEYARREGFEVLPEFFDRKLAKVITRKFGTAQLVTATNVFAHVDDIISFSEGIREILSLAGVFVIEFPYVVDMVESKLFDTIYHEHLCYLGLTPLTVLFSKIGLRPFKVEHADVGASGPALRLFVCREEAAYAVDSSVGAILKKEEEWGIKKPERYLDFSLQVSSLKTELIEIIESLRKKGHLVGAFGAPAKGNTMLNYLELKPSQIVAVAENNELKFGKLTPGSHIPILSDEEFLKLGVSHALLLSWNYADFFLKNSEFIKRGGKFIIPIPQPSIV
jgi:SAM-dependent methyltransferase